MVESLQQLFVDRRTHGQKTAPDVFVLQEGADSLPDLAQMTTALFFIEIMVLARGEVARHGMRPPATRKTTRLVRHYIGQLFVRGMGVKFSDRRHMRSVVADLLRDPEGTQTSEVSRDYQVGIHRRRPYLSPRRDARANPFVEAPPSLSADSPAPLPSRPFRPAAVCTKSHGRYRRSMLRLPLIRTICASAPIVILLPGCGPASQQADPQDDVPTAEVRSLEVAAVHDGERLQIRFRFETASPSWYHQYLVYRGGKWGRYGDGADGPDPHGLYEDRISVMIDDGSVDHFPQLGGFTTAHSGMRSFSDAVPTEEVQAHPHLGERLGRSDVRKFIAASRESGAPPTEAWSRTLPPEELEDLRANGVFLDLWQWRAHRSNPVGYADNGYILDYRHSSEGRSMYTDNFDPDTGLPLMMYDPEAHGRHALRFERLVAGGYDQDDPYYLAETSALPFDPEEDWEEGDALPHRLLRQPSGSRGAIRALGRHADGAWQVRLTRTLEAPNPRDSKAFYPGHTYHLAFAVHTGSTGARHHLVSMPVSFALDGEADLVASRTDGDLDAADADWITVPLFDPGDPTASR